MSGSEKTFRSVTGIYRIVICLWDLIGEMENSRRAQLEIKVRILDKLEIESWSPKSGVENILALNEIFKEKD